MTRGTGTRLYAIPRGRWNPDTPKQVFEGLLISSKGEMLGLGKGASIEALQDDLCVTDKNVERHAKLAAHYPRGYKVVWIESSKHAAVQAALRRLRAQKPKEMDLPTGEDAETYVAGEHPAS